MYTDTEIAQALATVESKLTLQSYSRCLKDSYGMADNCPTFLIGCLLLLRFALLNWDNRPGAVNYYSVQGLNGIIRRINSL